jgi:hypothetical protein
VLGGGELARAQSAARAHMPVPAAKPAAGQTPAVKPRAPTASEVDAAVRVHDRARIHPGDPLALVGVEQGDNNLRGRTPVLENSVRAPTLVDADEHYRRTLALYENRAHFNAPLALASPGAEHFSPSPNAPRPASAPPTDAAASTPSLPWIAAAVLAFGLLAWGATRFSSQSRGR